MTSKRKAAIRKALVERHPRDRFTLATKLNAMLAPTEKLAKKQFRTKCEFYEIPFAVISDKETLGHAIGKEERSSVALDDEGFANAIFKHLKSIGGNDIENQ